MVMRIMKLFLCFLVFFTLASCLHKTNNKRENSIANSLTVYAAAGTRLANEEIALKFSEKEGCSIVANYASSGTLARQIANGADCDIFISANKQWIDYLLEKKLLLANSVQILAKNSLVVIAANNSDVMLPIFSKETELKTSKNDKIAIGNPEFVPVGKYSKMVLDSLGWYEKLTSNLVMCKDVSSVRHYVELGECDWGIVYYSEAVQSNKIDILYKIPNELHKPINFYVAIHKNANLLESEKYIELISSFEGQEILEKFGFNTNVE